MKKNIKVFHYVDKYIIFSKTGLAALVLAGACNTLGLLYLMYLNPDSIGWLIICIIILSYVFGVGAFIIEIIKLRKQ